MSIIYNPQHYTNLNTTCPSFVPSYQTLLLFLLANFLHQSYYLYPHGPHLLSCHVSLSTNHLSPLFQLLFSHVLPLTTCPCYISLNLSPLPSLYLSRTPSPLSPFPCTQKSREKKFPERESCRERNLGLWKGEEGVVQRGIMICPKLIG